MFQLYKPRNFSNVFDDTIKFFKTYGKTYFLNYFKITGVFLIILLVFFWFGYSFLYDGFFNTAGGSSGAYIEKYFENNFPLLITVGILGFLFFYVMSIISTIYPYAFLNLIEKNIPLTFDNILNEYKSKIGRSIKFSIFSMFTILPIAIIAIVISFLLIIVLIGIPLIIILYGAVLTIFTFTFIEYINTKNGYFKCIQNGLGYFFKKPWLCIGVSLVFYIIVQMISGTISMIPYFIGFFDLIVGTEGGKSPEPGQMNFFFAMMMLTLVLSFFSSLFSQNIIFINQGLLYYSNKEVTENVSAQSEIDLIGSSSNEE